MPVDKRYPRLASAMTDEIGGDTVYTDEEVLGALEAVVAKAGEDYCYTNADGITCFYTPNDATPYGCIAGATFADLGEDVTRWDVWSEDVSGELVVTDSEPIKAVQDAVELMSHRMLEAMSAAQLAQDGGMPWGDALTAARKVLDNYPS